MFNYPDSRLQFNSQLIWCIEEVDDFEDKQEVNNILFIGYNQEDKKFVLRGKRNSGVENNYVPYAFNNLSRSRVKKIVKMIMGSNDTLKFTLYNYNNIEIDINNLTYDFFYEYMHDDYALVSYHGQQINTTFKDK